MKSYVAVAVVVGSVQHCCPHPTTSAHNFSPHMSTICSTISYNARDSCSNMMWRFAVVHRVENIPRNLMCLHGTLSKSSYAVFGIP